MIWVRRPARCSARVLISCEEFLEDENGRRVAAFGYHAGKSSEPRTKKPSVCYGRSFGSPMERISRRMLARRTDWTMIQGYAGAALALENWAWQIQHAETPLPGKKPYNTQSDLVEEVKSDVSAGVAKNDGKAPQILVIGALGRCGRGAIDLCLAAGIPEPNILRWDLAET